MLLRKFVSGTTRKNQTDGLIFNDQVFKHLNCHKQSECFPKEITGIYLRQCITTRKNLKNKERNVLGKVRRMNLVGQYCLHSMQ